MKLTPATERLILHWGEMGTRWGVNRTVAQIHALLYLAGRPLEAQEIAETLGVARSNVSTSLKELQRWEIVRVVHLLGDRRDHFETLHDAWEMFRIIVAERKRREIDPTIRMLRACVATAEEGGEATARLASLLDFFETVDRWYAMASGLPPAVLRRLAQVGSPVEESVAGGR